MKDRDFWVLAIIIALLITACWVRCHKQPPPDNDPYGIERIIRHSQKK
jgi:hypothetical protein